MEVNLRQEELHQQQQHQVGTHGQSSTIPLFQCFLLHHPMPSVQHLPSLLVVAGWSSWCLLLGFGLACPALASCLQQPTNARVEEVDLTAEPSSSQHALQLQDKQAQQQLVVAAVGPAMATVAALSMAAGLGLHLRDMLRQVVLQDDEMSELGGSDVAALDGLPTSGERLLLLLLLVCCCFMC